MGTPHCLVVSFLRATHGMTDPFGRNGGDFELLIYLFSPNSKIPATSKIGNETISLSPKPDLSTHFRLDENTR
jgi:hypothetical protein